jgi:protein-tyrosine phosphatase
MTMAESWLKDGAVHFFASDAHNVTSRPLQLKEAYAKVASKNGDDVAEGLFVDNPRAVFDGEALPFVLELPEDRGHAPGARKKKKRFWFF